MTKTNTNDSMNDDEDCPLLPLPPSNLKATMPAQNFSSWGDAFQFAASVTPQDLGSFNPESTTTGGSATYNPTDNPGDVAAISLIAKEYEALSSQKRKAQEPTEVREKVKKKHKKDKKAKKEKEDLKSSSTSVSSSGSPKKKSKKEKKAKKARKKESKKDTDGDLDHNATASSEHDEKPSTAAADTDTSDSSAPSSSTSPLEGQMVIHNGEALMVLVDRPKQIVYSMDRNASTGELDPIGKVIDGKVKITAEKKPSPSTATLSTDGSDFPYPIDPDDHCESPLNSYEDIKPILDHLAKSIKPKHNLRIYDPYYCNGLVKENLAEMGYSNVYNVKEDAYKTWDESDESQPYPEYDVFVTNPPYSEDHIEHLIRHLTTSHRVVKGSKPWCLLMPTYVHKKEYYKQAIGKKRTNHSGSGTGTGIFIQPFYLIPKRRYVYLPPKNFREKKDSDVHKKSSPFVSMWYIWGGSTENNESLIRAFQKHGDGSCELARSVSALRDLRRKGKKKK